MKLQSRQTFKEFVEQAYFGNVARQDLPAVMACFNPYATVIIRHGDNPVRNFSVAAESSEDNLQAFYAHLCGNYDAWFGEFTHFVDTEAQRSACYFTVRLTPKPDGLYADAPVQTLRNCNFFEYADDRIQHMIIYYSNTESAGDAPTGYPKQGA
jgi:hypothetical protein